MSGNLWEEGATNCEINDADKPQNGRNMHKNLKIPGGINPKLNTNTLQKHNSALGSDRQNPGNIQLKL